MKKSLFIASIAAVLLLALVTGCKHDPEPTPVPTPTPTPTPPTANAGSDFEHNVTTGGASITLSGSGNVTGGTIVSYAWSCTGKPSGAADPSFSNAATASPTVSGFNKLGEYQFTLKVTDNKGAESAASVVKAALVRTASTTLNIAANSFFQSTELDFAPVYTDVSNPGDFSTGGISSALTYTFTVVNHDASYTNTWDSASGFDGKIPVRSEYGTDLATFTQTFYHNGTVVGTPRVLKVMVDADAFAYFGADYSAVSGSIPAINGITISRKVTSGNM